jgi:amino acid transporter
VFTFVNCLGVKSGTRTQNVLTAANTLGLAILGLGIFAAGKGTWSHFTSSAAGMAGSLAGVAGSTMHSLPIAMALGLVTVLYTYDGWIDVTYTAGEVQRPERVLPRAILLGTAACVGLYLLVNAAYLYVLAPGSMAGVENVAAVALERAFGAVGGTLLSVLVVTSTLGILNGSILTGVRVPYAMARDGLLFRALGRINPRTISPVNALVAQGALSCLVVLFAAGFDEIASLFVSTTWFFYAVSFAGLLVIQARERRDGRLSGSIGAKSFPEGVVPVGSESSSPADSRELARPGANASGPPRTARIPFSAPAAVIFIVVTLFIIGSDLVFSGPRVLVGMAIVAAGVPVYLIWSALRSHETSPPSPAP